MEFIGLIRDSVQPTRGEAHVQPFLKWAGGKRWLAALPDFPLPTKFERYVEPFLGGGAIFFSLAPERAVLSDVNPELMNLYGIMRDAPAALRELMELHQQRHCDDHYYRVRDEAILDPLEAAARTLYLNRTCWNGLYRVNLKGAFNVPIGTKLKVIDEMEDFHAIAARLKRADLYCGDFEEVVDQCGEGDFVFLDPPYTVRHNMNGFIKYNERLFGWADQERLRDSVARALHRGAAIVITNADHESLKELYRGILDYRSVGRASVLAGSGGKRGPTTEAVFFANL